MISQGNYWRNVLKVLTSSAAAQAIPLLGSLLIARIFLPTEYGEYAIWLGIVATCSVVITGRFEMALAIEAEGEPRRVATHATLFVVLCGGLVLTAIGMVLLYFELVHNLPAVMVLIVGLAAAATAVSQTVQAWAAADGKYWDLGIIRIVQAGAVTLMQIIAGMIDSSAPALALAYLIGVTVGVFIAFWRLRHACHWPKLLILTKSSCSFLFRQRKFPMLALPADSINTAAAQLPLIIVAHRFGADVAGFLALTLRMVGAPIGLLGASVLDVFRRSSAASYSERGECQAEYLDTFRVLAIGSCAVAVVLALVAEPSFVLAFGETWRMSGTVAAWLMPMFALRFVASPLSYMFYVAGKQHLDFLWQLMLLAMTLASLWLPNSFEFAMKAYGAGYAALYGIYLLLSFKISKGVRA